MIFIMLSGRVKARGAVSSARGTKIAVARGASPANAVVRNSNRARGMEVPEARGSFPAVVTCANEIITSKTLVSLATTAADFGEV